LLGNETFAGYLTIARGKIMTKSIVFRSARVFDGESEALLIGVNVFVQGVISEISERPAGADEEVVDCGGRILMPGLIDAHVHVYAAGLNIVRVAKSPMSYLAHFAAQFLHARLIEGSQRSAMSEARTLAWCWSSRTACLIGSAIVLWRLCHLANRRPR
jgi:imidazolonepropionase-like amidohydrolase